MSVSTLTNTIWVIKSSPDLTYADAWFSINFVSNGNNYTELRTSLDDDIIRYYRNLYDTVYNLNANSTWSNQAYRIIEITGGTDVTNPTLISWLESNATQVSVVDLSDTKWVINNTFSSDFDYHQWHINFTSNNSNYNIFEIDNVEDIDGPYTNEIYYLDNNLTGDVVFSDYNYGWGVNGGTGAFRIIEITDGTDTTNPDLLEWLSQNATQVQVTDLTNTKWLLNDNLYSATTFTTAYYAYIEKLTCIQVSTGNRVEIDLMYNDAPGYFDSGYKVMFVNGDGDNKCWWDTPNTRYYSLQYSGVKSIMFEIIGGPDVSNPDLLVWLHENATQVQVIDVTDLTNTKWIINDDEGDVLFREISSGSDITYNINFSSNGNSYTSIRFKCYGAGDSNEIYYGNTTAYNYDYNMPDVEYGWIGGQAYRIIEITNGNDVTNATLITWLEAHAVQVNVFNLTGTKWLFKNTIDVSNDFNYEINFLDATSVEFYLLQVENDVIFGGKSLFYISDEDDYDVTNTAFNSLNGWQDNSYKTIEFISGTDIANPDLIVWLTENATLQPTITFDLSTLQLSAGTHEIKVKARAIGYIDSDFSNIISYLSVPQLATPTISITDDILTISAVTHATTYKILVNETQATTTSNTSFDLTTLSLASGTYSITVIASATGYTDSETSVAESYTVVSLGDTYWVTNAPLPSTTPKNVDLRTKYSEYSETYSVDYKYYPYSSTTYNSMTWSVDASGYWQTFNSYAVNRGSTTVYPEDTKRYVKILSGGNSELADWLTANATRMTAGNIYLLFYPSWSNPIHGSDSKMMNMYISFDNGSTWTLLDEDTHYYSYSNKTQVKFKVEILSMQSWDNIHLYYNDDEIFEVGYTSGTYYTQNITVDSSKPMMFYAYSYTECFTEGTQILLADRTTKNVEDITYDDDLLVWNFYEGKYDTAKPCWIMRTKTAYEYKKVTLSNGTILKLVGPDEKCHRLYNVTKQKMLYANECVGDKVYTTDGIVTVLSCEKVGEKVKYYNLSTEKYINCFAEGVLTGSRLNNMYHISDMKYDSDVRLISETEEAERWRIREALRK